MTTRHIVVLASAAAVLSIAGFSMQGTSAAPTAADIAAETAAAPPDGATAWKTECGACHMPYPAGFLPARSWQAITADLSKHFGEDASLDAATTQAIADYLVANAADSTHGNPRMLRGLAAGDVPLRITATPWWTRRHGEIPASAFAKPAVKTKSNCLACHGGGAYRD
jgi:hypothetical protein